MSLTKLTISTDNDLILKSNRIVLPIPYQRIAVKLAHIGHLGVVKTKALLRSKSYFPGMDKAVEDENIKMHVMSSGRKRKSTCPAKHYPNP